MKIYKFNNASPVFDTKGEAEQYLKSLNANENRRETNDCYITIFASSRNARHIVHIRNYKNSIPEE